MKISIKKKYIAFVTFNLFLVLGYWHFTILLESLSHYGFFGWVYPILFLVSFTWIILYFKELRDKHKLSRKVAEEVADEESQSSTNRLFSPETVRDEVENHLWNKSWDEAYTLNILMGKIKFTSSWAEQDKIEKLNSNKNIPDIIKQEFIKRI